MNNFRRMLALCVALSLGHATVAQAGGLITAEQVVQHQAAAQPQDTQDARGARVRLQAMLERDDVAQALSARGVAPAEARARVEALTDAEATTLMAEIDRAPAGASELIGTVVLVAVLLVFTDILGYTHLFPFLHPAR